MPSLQSYNGPPNKYAIATWTWTYISCCFGYGGEDGGGEDDTFEDDACEDDACEDGAGDDEHQLPPAYNELYGYGTMSNTLDQGLVAKLGLFNSDSRRLPTLRFEVRNVATFTGLDVVNLAQLFNSDSYRAQAVKTVGPKIEHLTEREFLALIQLFNSDSYRAQAVKTVGQGSASIYLSRFRIY
jgi:hypothetical protein